MKSLYAQHLETLQARSEQALEHCGFDYLIIGSGHSELRFLDDYQVPFKSNPHFSQWVPLQDKQHCWLLIRPEQQPVLLYYQPSDFWHLIDKLPDDEWATLLDVKVYDKKNTLDVGFGRLSGKGAIISPPREGANLWGCQQNPSDLLDYIHYKRAFKTEWEQQNLRKANDIAVLGHNAAERGFLAGDSEYQIHQAYLSATQQCEKNLPYGNIVALNTHGSILHYQYQNIERPTESHSLLIDAGATYQGYASDITRTFTPTGTLFADLVAAVDQAQQELINTICDGYDYVKLHQVMRGKLASILSRFNIVYLDVEGQLETGIINTFFPHGLGHLLGLQVHDIGGFQQSLSGSVKAAPEHSPALRLTRTLASDMVITIEPGLYFIESLLAKLASDENSKYVNWSLIDELRPYGGIRIEDNILVTKAGYENFTRDAFANAE
ncbi:Xaa-Pro dipeptidase [Leucothrix arctica]|uniref:Xaa-Pro dipeptidase n=1 Tax=Leucothrix arctica TaxID=1481894 RepID=A0A317CQC4_9GAMM|nr:Xaa-Pro dipeptidase [Leucothrix arctica]PWQ99723.1 Xaa-Pro dipeptidase [Leucothrix arctica]